MTSIYRRARSLETLVFLKLAYNHPYFVKFTKNTCTFFCTFFFPYIKEAHVYQVEEEKAFII